MKKYRIYIDEVGNPDLKNLDNSDNNFLCLAGVIFDLNYVLKKFHPELEKLKENYFSHHPDEPVILHRKELLHKKPPFHSLKNSNLEQSFNNELLQYLSEWDFKIIGAIIDKKEFCNVYSLWDKDPYHLCLQGILERYRLFLKMENAVGDVMIESRGGKEDMLLKKDFRRVMEEGTAYLAPSDLSQQITSKELKIKTKEANIAGLQLADLLAHSVRRHAFGNFWNMYETKITFSDQIIATLINHNKFFEYKGSYIGYGLKKLP